MSNIKQQTLKRALTMLDAIGATYAVIEENGTKHGTLEVSDKKKKSPRKYKHGELSSYVKSFLENMKVGQVVELPSGVYPIEDLRSAVASWACYYWGNGTVTTASSKEKQIVEVLRIS